MGDTLQTISAWISGQRWFSGKGHDPQLREISRQQLASDDPEATVTIFLVMDDAGAVPTLYQVPVVERRTVQPAERRYLIGESPTGGYLFDGPHDPAFPRALLTLIAPQLAAESSITATKVLAVEQSNTSIIYDLDGVPAVICKVFRTLHHGDNPDVTLQRAISETGSTVVPRFVGELHSEWTDVGREGGRAFGHLAFAQEFLAGSEDGWKVALRSASDGDDFTALASDLGRQTAEVHAILASVFDVVDPSPADIAGIVASWSRRLRLALEEVPALIEFTDSIESVYAAARASEWPALQRIHGDFHLGQALLVADRGWVFVDFEGEPLRPMHERDRPDVTLRDVSGMLRSFDYAAGSTPGWPTEWADAARAAFLAAYAATSRIDLEACRSLLSAFELDKAVYEAIYEARNRPDWLGIPLRGIEQLARRHSSIA